MKKRTGIVLLAMLTMLIPSAILSTVSAQGVILTPQDNEAKQDIISNMSDAVDHRYDRYDLIIGSVKGDNSTFTIYNVTGDHPMPPIQCGEGTHEENGACVPDEPEQPQCDEGEIWNATSEMCEKPPVPPDDNTTEPEPESNTIVDLSGDFDGTSVIKAMNGDYNVGLGDLLYKSTLNDFIKVWDTKKNHLCIPGNHDQEEDGNENIAKQSSEYCGDVWVKKVANGTTVLVAANTNGDLGSIKGTVIASLQNDAYMDDVKNVVLVTHKPCETFPGSHHGVENSVKGFCNAIETEIPTGINFVLVSAHNHEIASKSDGSAFVAGGGGKTSHRDCNTGSGWTFCKETNGFLKLTIDNDSGKITAKFYNTSGNVIS